MLDDNEVQRVLVVTAHPDDVDFGSAGTVASWTDKGIEVAYCIVTDGDGGGFDPAIDRADIPAIRQAEQRAAAAEVGVSDVTFLGYPDGRIEVTYELRRDISRQIRRVRPDRVLTQTPERNYERVGVSHPDHMRVGEATLFAVYPDARNPFAHPELIGDEGLQDWKVKEVWLGGDAHADHFHDITAQLDRKLAAIHAHHSQLPDPAAVDGFVREWLSSTAQRGGLGEGRYAEAFRVITTA